MWTMITEPEDSEWEELADGRRVKRGPDGKIEDVILPSSVASQMGQMRYSKAARAEDDLEGLLLEAGFDQDHPAPVHIKLLAGQFAGGGTQAIGAAREFIRLTRPSTTEATLKPRAGEVCGLCGQYVLPRFKGKALEIWNHEVDRILAMIDKSDKEQGIVHKGREYDPDNLP